MTTVTIFNTEVTPAEILTTLRDHGFVAINSHTRPSARALRSAIQAIIEQEADSSKLSLHELPIPVDGYPWSTNILFLSPPYDFDRVLSLGLMTRALNAWIAGGQIDCFLYDG